LRIEKSSLLLSSFSLFLRWLLLTLALGFAALDVLVINSKSLGDLALKGTIVLDTVKC
jgi:hypothetical protein